MKKIKLLIIPIFLLFFCSFAMGQKNYADSLYQKAYSEILEMLEGKTKNIFKTCYFSFRTSLFRWES